MGSKKQHNKEKLSKAKRKNGGMDLQEYDRVLSRIKKYELRNEQLKMQFENKNQKKDIVDETKNEDNKNNKNNKGNKNSKHNKDNNPITFKEKRKEFVQGLTKAQNHAKIMAAQDAMQERQIKMLQAIERIKKQEQNVENEEQGFNMLFNTEIEEIEPIGWEEKYKISNTEERNSLAGGEYMKHIEEINAMIDRERRANARGIVNAQNCIITTSEER